MRLFNKRQRCHREEAARQAPLIRKIKKCNETGSLGGLAPPQYITYYSINILLSILKHPYQENVCRTPTHRRQKINDQRLNQRLNDPCSTFVYQTHPRSIRPQQLPSIKPARDTFVRYAVRALSRSTVCIGYNRSSRSLLFFT